MGNIENETLDRPDGSEQLEKQTHLDRAKELINDFRQRMKEFLPGKSEREVADATGDALSDFAIAEAEKPQTVDQASMTAEAFIASDIEAVEDLLVGSPNDPIKKEVMAGEVGNIIDGVREIADGGELSTAEAIARDVEMVEAELALDPTNIEAHDERLNDIKLLESGEVTAAVYLKDSESLGLDEIKRLKNQAEAWTDERQAWHEEELLLAIEAAKQLSEKLGHPPRIIAMRGGCGSGKSFAVKSLYGDRGVFDEQGDVPGAVKPDYFKTRIKHKELETPPPPGVKVTSEQVHLESTGMNAMFTEKLVEDPEASLLIDKQLEAAGDIPSLIAMGKEHGKPVELLDNDVPIELSAFRVLKRQVGGVDPNIKFDGVAAGFLGIRVNREDVYDRVESEEVVAAYSLRAFDPESKQQIEIATKQEGKVVVKAGYEDLAEHVISQTKEDAKQEIQLAGSQVITAEYVESFVGKYFDDSERTEKSRVEARKILGAYVGLDMTMEEALASKAAGIEADPDSPTFTDNYRDKLMAWQNQ